jgi:hypothetical protein
MAVFFKKIKPLEKSLKEELFIWKMFKLLKYNHVNLLKMKRDLEVLFLRSLLVFLFKICKIMEKK